MLAIPRSFSEGLLVGADGYGQHMWYNSEDGPSRDMWAIIDQVQVPNITGDFVLRWRWDTEQNPQIWSHCADVRIA